jgi:hypothetical protein
VHGFQRGQLGSTAQELLHFIQHELVIGKAGLPWGQGPVKVRESQLANHVEQAKLDVLPVQRRHRVTFHHEAHLGVTRAVALAAKVRPEM